MCRGRYIHIASAFIKFTVNHSLNFQFGVLILIEVRVQDNMPLFEVPGWTVPSTPIASTSSSSKKRKRPDSDSEFKVQSAAVNVEKLFAKLGQGNHDQSKRKKGKGNGDKDVERNMVERKAGGQSKAAKKAVSIQAGQDNVHLPQPAPLAKGEKRQKNKKGKGSDQQRQQHTSKPVELDSNQDHSKQRLVVPTKGLTALQANMKHSLDGARFRLVSYISLAACVSDPFPHRWINETLYKSDSEHARQMMRENPSIFSEVHWIYVRFVPSLTYAAVVSHGIPTPSSVLARQPCLSLRLYFVKISGKNCHRRPWVRRRSSCPRIGTRRLYRPII